ncbi:GDSL-type esterase/lipase family protein [Nocardia sp. NPDC004860]|uniref:GDSL-type esterase/lipase family protein n=1 Tax=Nocardia sp. NPDC004860 TaxID=3154557 RepID=UPI0033B2F642
MVVKTWMAGAGVLLMLTGAPVAAAEPASPAGCGGSHWVGSWLAAPSDSFSVIDPALSPQFSAGDQTYRLVITPHRGGSTVRVHLTDRTRPTPIEIGHVTIGAQADNAAVQPDSLREVTFGGSRTVTIPAHGDAISDPIELTFDAFEPLSVSVYVPGVAVLPTEHFDGNATSFYSPPFAGDRAAEPSGAALSLHTTAIPLVSGLDVVAPGDIGTIVAFGDSITDGYVAANYLGDPQDHSVVDRNVRYPDFLQRRLDAAGRPFTVLNAGISGNRVSREGLIPQFGPDAVSRIQADAIDQAGVTDVILAEGINDLGVPIGASYEQIIAAYTTLIDRLHAAGLRVHLATLMPASNALLDGILTLPYSDPVRVRVNAWIRGQHLADHVIDFDAALRNPADPSVLDPRFAGPDNLHPNATGYRAMADAIDLDAFQPRCS